MSDQECANCAQMIRRDGRRTVWNPDGAWVHVNSGSRSCGLLAEPGSDSGEGKE